MRLRVPFEPLDCRINLPTTIAQYNLYCDGSYTPPAPATIKNPERIQKAGWAFIIAAQYSPEPKMK